VADDRGIREDVQRLRGERSERRDGEPQDLPVVRGSQRHERAPR
jgi:hypothetical protein